MYPEGFDATQDKNRPICGVLAVAIAAGVSFDVAFAACKRNMPKHRQRMRGSTYKEQRDAALKELGVKFNARFRCNDIHTFSVLQFCEMHANDGFVYLLEVRGHVMTFRDGCIIDQGKYIPWQSYAKPRIKLKRVVKIIGKGW